MPGAAESVRRSAGAVDQAHMRAANMGLVLRHLRDHGGRSRARLAAETGLSKAAVSTLVGELAERGLVREGRLDRDGSVGRPGITLDLDGGQVAGLGVEISVDYVSLTAIDLDGTVLREAVHPLDAARLAPTAVIDRVAAVSGRVLRSLGEARIQVMGLTVSPPGVIDYDGGLVRFAPNIGWRGIPLVAELTGRLGAGAPLIRLENDAKLGALAEYSQYASEGVQDLLYLTGEVGVGAGIIAGGRLVRGWSGFSGEVGHLPLDPEGHPCGCGRTGCWETVVGLAALLRTAAGTDDPVNDPARPIEDRLTLLRERAATGDAHTLDALATIAGHLSTGLSILVDVLNPRVIVLGGFYAYFAGHLLPPLRAALSARRMDAGSEAVLAVSRFGFMSAARGGAVLALERVFDDPTLVALPA